MKFLLCIFEQVSGLKINFHKSEMYCLGEAMDKKDAYSEIFTCNVGKLPFQYLGMPIVAKNGGTLNGTLWKRRLKI